MQLWTDYEGVTIDGAYPLKKLLMPEGRSAFYSTTGPNGESTVVRLIECHFDEEEILSRWRCVEALNHPNFLKFENFGQTEIDGRPVVYAVLEKVDGNLAEVLDQGTLSASDVEQLTSSLVAALDVLHTHGFIHEHVEPRNIFALNDVVKLRSDCIREAPEGEEGRAAKAGDVHDLAAVLLQALTQKQSIEGVSDFALPAPFNRIIRKGLDGTWSLADIKAALEGNFTSQQPAAPNWANAAPAPSLAPSLKAAPEQKAPAAPTVKPSLRPDAQLPLPLRVEDRTTSGWIQNRSPRLNSRWLGIAGLVALLILALVWAVVRGRDPHPQSTTPAEATAPLAAAAQPIATSEQSASGSPRETAPAPAESRAGWRVIAFTYNRRSEAEKKVSQIAKSHPALEPEVFAPSGRAPFYVSIDGVMDQSMAHSLVRRARSFGLPRDTFARDYR